MKRFVINVIGCLASFTFGVGAFVILNWIKHPVTNEQPQVNVSVRCQTDPLAEPPPSMMVAAPTASPNPEVFFDGGRLVIVPDEVQLKSERLRYKINVRYPQIVGSEDLHIRQLNQRLKQIATKQYEWPLSPSRSDLRYYRDKWPGVFNTVDIDYEIRSTSNTLLSIYFVGYSYGIGAANSVQYSFAMNYDLTLRKELELSEIFKPRSKYLEFISLYCVNRLSKQSDFIFEEALTPRAENFESWNLTSDGIRFNFDECRVFGCASGEQTVVIPFAELQQLLNRRAVTAFSKQ
jgi:hypothetical protein